ncbi:MAG TPA: cyclic nucleotide-binding domain-containing protein [Candidatus Binatia bacterium]|nr:cyclic nucleotide-binding domain-containing protein [Candidatus Binatia bacterium]
MTELASAPLFAGLPEAELKEIAASFKEVHHPPGTEITVGGATGVGFMVVGEGELEVLLPGRTRRLGPGAAFGEMALLDSERRRSATVRTTTEVTLHILPVWEFKPFLADHPEVSYRMLQHLSRRLREVEGSS